MPASPPPSKTGSRRLSRPSRRCSPTTATEAGLTEKAVDYWLAAGRQAWARSALAEAVALLRRGLALVPALPDGDRRRETRARSADRARSGADREPGLGRAGGWARSTPGRGSSRLTLNRPRALLFALWGQFADHCAPSRSEAGATACCARCESLGEASRRRRHAGDGLHMPAGIRACPRANLPQARAYVEKGLALYDPAHRPFLRGAAALRSAGPVYWFHSCWLLGAASDISIRHCPDVPRRWRRRAGSPIPTHWLLR